MYVPFTITMWLHSYNDYSQTHKYKLCNALQPQSHHDNYIRGSALSRDADGHLEFFIVCSKFGGDCFHVSTWLLSSLAVVHIAHIEAENVVKWTATLLLH